MQQNNIIDRIEIILKRDENSIKKFELSQLDYNFSTSHNYGKDAEKTTEVYLSGSINSKIDEFLLNWVANQEGEWAGSIQVFFKHQDKPELSLNFQNSSVTSFNQSFMENNPYSQQGVYFSASLRGVELNNVPIN
ncbi:type VI secretion system tube protein TssD [Salegentibacter maritimus]|uniref:type VI secretion system tube protein TssD n=1 Tax=Salegentibacter maritimus TaxID=2794347 RepID=UPI0018E465DD|nr:type VI secretion system tube protein TssD [Salegentibacter maritimus]MBI6116788.1 hypothetical protein [Salegentibacter maritimus]